MSVYFKTTALAIFTFAGCQAYAQQGERAGRPNVIVILADDLGWGDLGQTDQRIATPNLDRLAAEGIRLTSFYTGSSLCSPTRASLLTGKYPHSVGVPDLASPEVRGDVPILALNHSAVTIPEALKSRGYKSMLAGKWHLGYYRENWPRTHGFDEFRGSLIGTPRYFEPSQVYENETQVNVHQYFTDWITDKAIDFINRNQRQPFFLYLAYNAPHYPLQAPMPLVNKYRKMFPDDGLYALYAAMVEQMDLGIGKVLTTIGELGIDKNTVILFCSDNGPSAEPQSYGLPGARISRGKLNGHKFLMYEGGIRVPFIARWPGRIPAGTISDTLATTMDILPTILQAAGLDPQSTGADGKSLIPLFRGEQTAYNQRMIHWENIYNMGVRSGNWKLIYQFWEDRPRLYDLSRDIGEEYDLYHRYPEVAKKLMEAHEKWKKNHYPNPIPRQLSRPLERIPTR